MSPDQSALFAVTVDVIHCVDCQWSKVWCRADGSSPQRRCIAGYLFDRFCVVPDDGYCHRAKRRQAPA